MRDLEWWRLFEYKYYVPHCNENPIYVFLFWELRGLSPHFHIHVSLSDLHIPRIGPHISCCTIGRLFKGIYSYKPLTDTWMWKLGLWPQQFLFGGYLYRIFGIGSLQCMRLEQPKMDALPSIHKSTNHAYPALLPYRKAGAPIMATSLRPYAGALPASRKFIVWP